MNFIAELKRRNVLRAAGLYLVGSWLTVQVASTVLPAFGAAGWVLRGLIIALAIGFLPAMIVAWVFELTPEGLKRQDEVEADESITPQTAKPMDQWLALTDRCEDGLEKGVILARNKDSQGANACADGCYVA